MYNIAILNLWPTPYKDPVYRQFHNLYADEYRLLVFYLNDFDKGHAYQTIESGEYDSVVIGKDNQLDYKSPAFWKSKKEFYDYFTVAFEKQKIDCVIIPGHGSSFCMGALSAAKKAGIPYVYSADTISNDTGNFLKKAIRHVLTSRYVHHAGSVWVPGFASRAYFREYGIADSAIFEGMYCLDLDKLSAISEEFQQTRQQLREEYGFAETDIVLLFAGRYLKVCNFNVMLTAFHQASLQNPRLKLVLVGGGDEKETIQRIIAQQGITNIELRDFIPIDKIGAMYVASDIYYMTYDWAHYSLACIQAAICRKPIITTNTLGAAYDCIDHEKNGYIIPPGNTEAATQAILKLAGLPSDARIKMGDYSFDKVRNRTLIWAASQMKQAVQHALGKGDNTK